MNEKGPPQGQVLIYRDGATRLQVRLDGATVWLTQAAMAELFQTTTQNITLHLQNIYDDTELSEEATCKECLQVRQEGGRNVRRSLKHYSLRGPRDESRPVYRERDEIGIQPIIDDLARPWRGPIRHDRTRVDNLLGRTSPRFENLGYPLFLAATPPRFKALGRPRCLMNTKAHGFEFPFLYKT